MSPEVIGLLGIIFLLALLALRLPVGLAMALVGLLGSVWLGSFKAGFSILGMISFKTGTTYGLTVIPLFILMGQFARQAGIAAELYRAFYAWLGYLPGGLGMATIGSCAGFAAVSGSSLATTATMGMTVLPEMKRYNYDAGFAAGCIAAGGTLGILLPPSTVMILYCVLTGQSIARLFLAGIIPGLILTVLFMITVYLSATRNPASCPAGQRFSFQEKMGSLKNTWAVLLLFGLVMGGIYFGWFTPTEAAGIGAFGAFLLIIIKKRFNLQLLTEVLDETARLTAAIFLILIGAHIFGYFITLSEIPAQLASWSGGAGSNRYLVILALIGIYIVLGCFLEGMAIMVISLPVVFPMVTGLGFDPIWFGIIMVLTMEMSLITPPVGMNVFVIKGIADDLPLYRIYRGVFPFWLALLACVLIIVLFPGLVNII